MVTCMRWWAAAVVLLVGCGGRATQIADAGESGSGEGGSTGTSSEGTTTGDTGEGGETTESTDGGDTGEPSLACEEYAGVNEWSIGDYVPQFFALCGGECFPTQCTVGEYSFGGDEMHLGLDCPELGMPFETDVVGSGLTDLWLQIGEVVELVAEFSIQAKADDYWWFRIGRPDEDPLLFRFYGGGAWYGLDSGLNAGPYAFVDFEIDDETCAPPTQEDCQPRFSLWLEASIDGDSVVLTPEDDVRDVGGYRISVNHAWADYYPCATDASPANAEVSVFALP